MPTINLLPWREELRQKRKKDFAMMALGAVLLAAAATMGTKVYYQAQIDNQDARNTTLRTEIRKLDEQIAEINQLDSRKRRLLDRMEIIDELERTTPETVTLVDALVDIMPEGTYLTAVRQQDTRIELTGLVQSNQRVADLLRNADQSEWLKNPFPDDVISDGAGAQRRAQFNVSMSQVRISDSQEELE